MPASWRKGTLYAGMCLWREWASATSGVARRPELNLLSLRVGVTWIPAFAGKTVGMGWGYVDSGFRRKDDICAKGTVGLPPNSGMTTDCWVVELILRQVLSRRGAVGGWDDTILPTPRRPAAPWSPRSGVPPVARRWAGLPGCCRRERKGLANRSDRTGRCR